MKPSVLLLALVCSACSPGNGPLFVSSIRTSTAGANGCSNTNATAGQLSTLGILDVAAPPDVEVTASLGGMADFFNATAQPRVALSTGQQLAPAGRERLVVQRVFVRYMATPKIAGIGTKPGEPTITDSIPRTLVIAPPVPTELPIQVPLFGPNARTKLAALGASNLDEYQFTATFEIQGVTEPSGAEFRTPPVAVPMTLVKTEVICATPNDQRLKRFSSASPLIRGCSFLGLNRRFSPGDCCLTVDASGNAALDLSQPGCDVLP